MIRGVRIDPDYNLPRASLDGLSWASYVLGRAPFRALANVAGFGREDLLLRLAAQVERTAL